VFLLSARQRRRTRIRAQQFRRADHWSVELRRAATIRSEAPFDASDYEELFWDGLMTEILEKSLFTAWGPGTPPERTSTSTAKVDFNQLAVVHVQLNDTPNVKHRSCRLYQSSDRMGSPGHRDPGGRGDRSRGRAHGRDPRNGSLHLSAG